MYIKKESKMKKIEEKCEKSFVPKTKKVEKVTRNTRSTLKIGWKRKRVGEKEKDELRAKEREEERGREREN